LKSNESGRSGRQVNDLPPELKRVLREGGGGGWRRGVHLGGGRRTWEAICVRRAPLRKSGGGGKTGAVAVRGSGKGPAEQGGGIGAFMVSRRKSGGEGRKKGKSSLQQGKRLRMVKVRI